MSVTFWFFKAICYTFSYLEKRKYQENKKDHDQDQYQDFMACSVNVYNTSFNKIQMIVIISERCFFPICMALIREST